MATPARGLTARGDWRIKSENSCLQLKLQISGKVQLKCESTFLGIFSSITPKPKSPTRGLTYVAKLLPFLRSMFNDIHMQNGDGGRGRWIFPSPDSSLPLELFERDWSCLSALARYLSDSPSPCKCSIYLAHTRLTSFCVVTREVYFLWVFPVQFLSRLESFLIN